MTAPLDKYKTEELGRRNFNHKGPIIFNGKRSAGTSDPFPFNFTVGASMRKRHMEGRKIQLENKNKREKCRGNSHIF